MEIRQMDRLLRRIRVSRALLPLERARTAPGIKTEKKYDSSPISKETRRWKMTAKTLKPKTPKAKTPKAPKAKTNCSPEDANLKKLARTQIPMSFVKRQNGAWNHQDWLAFLEEIKAKGYDPIDTDKVGLLLEEKKVVFLTSREG